VSGDPPAERSLGFFGGGAQAIGFHVIFLGVFRFCQNGMSSQTKNGNAASWGEISFSFHTVAPKETARVAFVSAEG